MDKQRSTKHTYKTKDRETRTLLKTEGELRCSGRVSSSCSTSGTRRVNLVTNPLISREWGKDREVFPTSGTYPWSFVTQIFHSGQPSHGGDRKIFEVMTSALPKGTLGSVASLLAASIYYIFRLFTFTCNRYSLTVNYCLCVIFFCWVIILIVWSLYSMVLYYLQPVLR